MSILFKTLIRMGLLKDDLDYHLIRASMVIIYFFFGYQKWFDYEAKGLVPFFTHGPLIFWMYPVFGMKGVTGHPCPRCQHIVRVIEPVPLHISVNLPGNRRDMRVPRPDGVFG